MEAVSETGIPENEKQGVMIAYVLHVLGSFTGLTAIVGIIINHIRVNEVTSEFARSHHRWMIRTFWWSLLWVVIGGITTLIFIGFLILFAVTIWWIYRLVRGILNYVDNKPMQI
ncbi:MAG: hypothetical protein K0U79_14110 [Gammaproteobacteria bacterium]|nr:hypothetical protein [Gammaproteobacteria bacterium]